MNLEKLVIKIPVELIKTPRISQSSAEGKGIGERVLPQGNQLKPLKLSVMANRKSRNRNRNRNRISIVAT